MKRTREEVAAIIDGFVNGTGGKWDWDDFTSIRLKDPELDAIRQKCVSLPDLFPPSEPRAYCSVAGLEALRGMVLELRSHPAGR